MQWTHDVHVLPSFLRAKDFPKYIKYLAETRQARTIFMSNSMLAYEMLPALREQLPDAVFVDYLHNEAYDGWKSGGYPTYSILHQRYLDRSISCSHHLKEWMVERGHTADRIGVVKLGVDLEKISEAHGQAKPALKHQLYDADPDSAVILSVARLDPQKRSLLMPDIISDLITYHGYSCGPIDSERIPVLMVMVGSGILEDALRDKIEEMGLTECFYLAGVQTDVSAYYQSADLFLLPSVSEGISVAVSEAMAAGLPVVAANAGALPEQIGREDDELRAGVVVTPSNRPEEHSALYAMAIDQLLSDPDLMDEYADNGLQRVQKSDWRSTLLGLLPELDLARAAHDNPRSLAELVELPHPAAHLALQTQLDEFKPFVDFSLVHSSLSAPTREGFGRELQVRCGDNADNSDWIDALEEPAICDRKHAADARALQESAKYQCGSCERHACSRGRLIWSQGASGICALKNELAGSLSASRSGCVHSSTHAETAGNASSRSRATHAKPSSTSGLDEH
jgi:glycosyltransferase involved in cell wall biosynthesis